ncbi:MAG: RIP metalloprotease RseP [Deltaproteobacteria bacterium]|nr:RIP metalloprotease RseP [Deltaproteobacteria bacterium]
MNIEYFLIAVLVLGILIFVHELGHFLVAKWNGVGVVEFSIGFGKKIWRRQIGETSYAIGLIPLGGYVRMVGDDPRELDTGKSEAPPLTPEEGDCVSEEERRMRADRSRWFLNKGFFAKSAIVIAGPGFNLLFAVLLSIASFYMYGKLVAVDSATIGDVIPGYPAEKAGVKAKDLVVSVDGKPVTSWVDLSTSVRLSDGKEVAFEIDRPQDGGTPQRITLRIAATDDTSELAVIEGTGSKRSVKIGIIPDSTRKEVTFSEAVEQGFAHVYTLSVVTVRGLAGMIQGAISPKHISGPIFIFKEAAKSAKKGFEHLLDFMTFLSVSLAILNLLPIPILDGGHLVFFIIQALRGGRPVSLRIQEMANQVGMVLLLLLMIFAFGNDLWKL